jgi:hypothetical protein
MEAIRSLRGTSEKPRLTLNGTEAAQKVFNVITNDPEKVDDILHIRDGFSTKPPNPETYAANNVLTYGLLSRWQEPNDSPKNQEQDEKILRRDLSAMFDIKTDQRPGFGIEFIGEFSRLINNL